MIEIVDFMSRSRFSVATGLNFGRVLGRDWAVRVATGLRTRQCLLARRQRPWQTRHSPARAARQPWVHDLVRAPTIEKFYHDRKFSITTDFSPFLYRDREFSVSIENPS